jgi:Flp pilus assembly protein protease CpaA
VLAASIYLFFTIRLAIYDRLWHVVPNRELMFFAFCEFRFLHFSLNSASAAIGIFVTGLLLSKYFGGGDTKLICLLSFIVPNLSSLISAIYVALFFGVGEISIAKLLKQENVSRIAFAPWILIGGLFGCYFPL